MAQPADMAQRPALKLLDMSEEDIQRQMELVSAHEEGSLDATSTASFYMYCYKVLLCPKRYSHDWGACPYAHYKENARRRDPQKYAYASCICPNISKGQCPKGLGCPYAHTLFEYWLHPSRFRTQMCKSGVDCKRSLCFFAHTAEELRSPAKRGDGVAHAAGPQQGGYSLAPHQPGGYGGGPPPSAGYGGGVAPVCSQAPHEARPSALALAATRLFGGSGLRRDSSACSSPSSQISAATSLGSSRAPWALPPGVEGRSASFTAVQGRAGSFTAAVEARSASFTEASSGGLLRPLMLGPSLHELSELGLAPRATSFTSCGIPPTGGGSDSFSFQPPMAGLVSSREQLSAQQQQLLMQQLALQQQEQDCQLQQLALQQQQQNVRAALIEVEGQAAALSMAATFGGSSGAGRLVSPGMGGLAGPAAAPPATLAGLALSDASVPADMTHQGLLCAPSDLIGRTLLQ